MGADGACGSEDLRLLQAQTRCPGWRGSQENKTVVAQIRESDLFTQG